MASVNTIHLIGRLTRDPENNYTPSGVAISKFGLAVDKLGKNQETGEKNPPDFFDCVAWRRTAEFVAQYITKGRLVYITGRMESRTWTAQDGSKRKAWEVQVEHVETLERRPEEDAYADESQSQSPQQPSLPTAPPAPPAAPSGNGTRPAPPRPPAPVGARPGQSRPDPLDDIMDD